ncbi:MAG: PH domain-containing protein [Propioniciclava sp.]|uniref:PH domain-containing protein n=1 Tax=Propioniciclava sp. TaxID=2038686 RepID=UPI0039E4CBBC
MTEQKKPAIEERMHPLSPLVNLWIGVVAIGWFAITSLPQGDPWWEDLGSPAELLQQVPLALLIPVGALLIALGAGYWGWWTTKFIIDDHEVRRENTGAFHASQRIAFSRIQSVDITQPFAARILGLAQVKIDVGVDEGITLSFLSRARATAVRDYVMARAHGRHTTTADSSRTTSAWDDSGVGDRILIRLTPSEILLSTLLSLQLASLLIGLGITALGTLVFDWPIVAIGGGVIGLGLALVGYLSKQLIGQFNYTLAATPAGLRITRGLATLRSQTIPVHRVQSLTIEQPLLWRWIGRARLKISILGIGDLTSSDEPSTSTVYLPIGTPQQIQIALAALWPGLHLERLTFTRTPERARWLDPLAWRWQGYAHDDQVFAARAGWITRTQTVVPHPRVLSVKVKQGPLERRLGLAGMSVLTAAFIDEPGIAHLEAGHARRLAVSQLDRSREGRRREQTGRPELRDAHGDVWAQGFASVPAPGEVWTPSLAAAAPPPPPAWFPPPPPYPAEGYPAPATAPTASSPYWGHLAEESTPAPPPATSSPAPASSPAAPPEGWTPQGQPPQGSAPQGWVPQGWTPPPPPPPQEETPRS